MSPLILDDNTASGEIARLGKSFTPATSGKYSMWVAHDTSAFAKPYYFADGKEGGSSGTLAVLVKMEDGQFMAIDDNAYTNIKAYSTDTWYHVLIEFDCSTDTYDIWIDGELLGEDLTFYQK